MSTETQFDVQPLPSELPTTKPRKSRAAHTDPNCACISCTARRRKAETFLSPAGTRGGTLEALAYNREEVLKRNIPLTTHPLMDGVAKERVARWIELRGVQPGISIRECARLMGTNKDALQGAINKGIAEGWLTFEDPIDSLEHQILPKVVKNLNQLLDEGDKQATLETAKGTIFRQYQEAKGISEAAQTVLAIKFEGLVDPTQQVKVTGNIVGKPKEID